MTPQDSVSEPPCDGHRKHRWESWWNGLFTDARVEVCDCGMIRLSTDHSPPFPREWAYYKPIAEANP